MANKNAGRYGSRDHSWFEYRRALPGTPERVAQSVGVSLRTAERDLQLCKRLGLVLQVGEVYEVTTEYRLVEAV